MSDLATQIGSYYQRIDAYQEAVSLDEILEPRLGTPPIRPLIPRTADDRSRRWWYGAAAAVIVLLLIGGVAALLRGALDTEPRPIATTIPAPPTTVPATTIPATPITLEPATEAPQPTTGVSLTGVSISDDEFAALFGPNDSIVSGTAIRLAWTDQGGRYRLGLFATEEFVAGEEPWHCLYTYGSGAVHQQNEIGGSQCAATAEQFTEMLAFGIGGSGTCIEPITHMQSVWGLPLSADSVTFELDDGTRLVVLAVEGVAQVAWEGDRQVHTIGFDDASPQQAEQLNAFLAANQLSCAEMNDPDQPG